MSEVEPEEPAAAPEAAAPPEPPAAVEPAPEPAAEAPTVGARWRGTCEVDGVETTIDAESEAAVRSAFGPSGAQAVITQLPAEALGPYNG